MAAARRYNSNGTHDMKVAQTTRLQVTSSGAAVTGTLSSTGALSSTVGVSGTTGTFSAGVSGTTGTFTDALSATSGTFTGAVTTTQGVSSGTALNVGGRAYSQTTVSNTITNTNTETVFTQGVFTIPANTLTAGKTVRISFGGTVPSTNSTDTLQIKLIIGGTETNTTGTALMTSAALDVANSDVFSGVFELTARAAPGAAVACAGNGFIGIGPLLTGTMRPQSLGGTNLATNGALPVKVSATWSVAHADNQAILQNFTVHVI